MTTPVLDVRDLRVSFGDTVVVDGVTFALDPGDRLGVIGASGSGKSLAALAMLGLSPVEARVSGSVQLDGHEILGVPEREIARYRGRDVGIVFQEPSSALNPVRTVGRQIIEAVRIRGRLSRSELRGRAIELARLVALPDPESIIDRYPHELSGGQKQRVCIAMAIANHPRVLIADEPTTALDVTVQADILDLFSRLGEELGMALVFITHDLAVLNRVVDRTLVLDHGRVVEEGSVRQVLTSPKSSMARALRDAALTGGGIEG